MTQVPLAPPPPTGKPEQDRWLWLLWKRISSSGQILWSYLDFTGSNLTDLITRNHNDLQSISGGATNDYYHLTQTHHTDLTDGGNTTLHKHTHNAQDSLQGGTAGEYYHLTLNDANIVLNQGVKYTGIVSGGVTTINGGDLAKIDITACDYFIQGIRYSYAGGTGLDPSFGVGQTARRIGLNSSGLFSQQGNFSDAQKQTIIPLVRVQALQGTSGPGATVGELIDLRFIIAEEGYYERIWAENVIGALYASGGGVSESATPLQITQASGVLFDAQRKRQTIPATANIEALKVYHSGGSWTVSAEATLVVDTANYDNGTNLTALTSTYWTAHTLLRSPKGDDQFFFVYGQNQYASQTEAEADGIQWGPFVSQAASGLVPVALIIVRAGATSINRIADKRPVIGRVENISGISSLLPVVDNSVTSIKNYEDAWRYYNSGSIIEGADFTDNGNGTFNLSSCEVVLRSGATEDAPLLIYTVAAAGPFTPTNNDVTYYYIDYNSGNPQWASTDSITGYNGLDKMQAWTVARKGTLLMPVSSRGQSVDGNRKLRRRDLEWDGNVQKGFWHARGGNVLGGTGLYITLTAGKFYYGLAPVDVPAFDTSVAGVANANCFDYYYNRGAYTSVDSQKTVNALQYDNAGTLTTMTNNKWRTDWVYVTLDGATARLSVIYGDAQYNSSTEALAAPLPSTLPGNLDGSSVLVGQIVILKSAATFTATSAFTSVFTGSTAVTDHNSLAGLQGGAAADYYHLTGTQATDLTDGGDSTLHYHSSDRSRANHTGTQTASTISDFDTEVSNNTDVAANTAARHAAVTVTDSTSIDLTLTGQQISAAAIFGTSAGTVAEGNHTHASLYQPLDTDLTAIAGLSLTANQVLGKDAAGTGWEGKTVTAGTGISVTHGVGTVTIATTGGATSDIYAFAAAYG